MFKSYRNSIRIKDHVNSKNISVGDYSYYAGYYHGHSFNDCLLYLDEQDEEKAVDRLVIGKFCAIASGVKFMMGGTHEHNHAWISAYPFECFEDFASAASGQQHKGDTVLGNDVWLGFEALVLPGVSIGDGAIVGARSVVAKPIGPYEIWAGNPAKLIRKRFSDAHIEKLLDMQWWNWETQALLDRLPLMQSNDVDGLYAATAARRCPR